LRIVEEEAAKFHILIDAVRPNESINLVYLDPPSYGTFKQAERAEEKPKATQRKMDF
jgi:hypothetical protein